MNKETKRFAIGSIIMAGIGYLAGILTAPKSGKETRKDVKDAAVKAKMRAEKELKKLHTELTKQLDRAKEFGKKLQKEHKDDLDKLVTAANNARIKAKQMLTNIHDGDAEEKDLKQAITDVSEAVDSLKTYLDTNQK
ncbi:YtxH domain-containing protein [Candidatus Saccharibacteria bacterium]|nr:YtxH domain-containing protein [Candidatus Saccharibacteria bacterium]